MNGSKQIDRLMDLCRKVLVQDNFYRKPGKEFNKQQTKLLTQLRDHLDGLLGDKTDEFKGMTNKELAVALNKATGASLKEADVTDWLGEDGVEGEGYNKVDEVVQEYMGEEMYREMCQLARLPGALMARLQGLDRAVIGGMQLINLQSGLKKVEHTAPPAKQYVIASGECDTCFGPFADEDTAWKWVEGSGIYDLDLTTSGAYQLIAPDKDFDAQRWWDEEGSQRR